MFRGGSDYFNVGEILRTGIFLHLNTEIAARIKPEDTIMLHGMTNCLTKEKAEEIMSDLGPFTATRVLFDSDKMAKSEAQKMVFSSFLEALKYCNHTMDGSVAKIFSKDSKLPFALVDAS